MSLRCLFLSFRVFFSFFGPSQNCFPFSPAFMALLFSHYSLCIFYCDDWGGNKRTDARENKQICFLSAGDVSKSGIWTGRPTRNVEETEIWKQQRLQSIVHSHLHTAMHTQSHRVESKDETVWRYTKGSMHWFYFIFLSSNALPGRKENHHHNKTIRGDKVKVLRHHTF